MFKSFNTEMEQVVAQVCLAKDKSLSSANVAAKEVRNKNWKGKLFVLFLE